jgi:hypothetical protein
VSLEKSHQAKPDQARLGGYFRPESLCSLRWAGFF